jgi:hypothetical protein
MRSEPSAKPDGGGLSQMDQPVPNWSEGGNRTVYVTKYNFKIPDHILLLSYAKYQG